MCPRCAPCNAPRAPELFKTLPWLCLTYPRLWLMFVADVEKNLFSNLCNWCFFKKKKLKGKGCGWAAPPGSSSAPGAGFGVRKGLEKSCSRSRRQPLGPVFATSFNEKSFLVSLSPPCTERSPKHQRFTQFIEQAGAAPPKPRWEGSRPYTAEAGRDPAPSQLFTPSPALHIHLLHAQD